MLRINFSVERSAISAFVGFTEYLAIIIFPVAT
jgi:hypothetical protein